MLNYSADDVNTDEKRKMEMVALQRAMANNPLAGQI
jgi:hypothetical protein